MGLDHSRHRLIGEFENLGVEIQFFFASIAMASSLKIWANLVNFKEIIFGEMQRLCNTIK